VRNSCCCLTTENKRSSVSLMTAAKDLPSAEGRI
jgi:hypothetical protein